MLNVTVFDIKHLAPKRGYFLKPNSKNLQYWIFETSHQLLLMFFVAKFITFTGLEVMVHAHQT